MKKYITSLLCLFFLFTSVNLLAQSAMDTIWYDANWGKTAKSSASYFRPAPEKKDNGYWLVDYYRSGKKQMEAFSLSKDEEKFDKEVTWYYENGNVMQTVNYKNTVLHGLRKNYHESGPLKSQYSYIDGKIEGEWKGYYPNAQLSETGNFKDGKRHGPWTEYYKSGKIKAEGSYDQGKKVGVWKLNYYDGSEAEE